MRITPRKNKKFIDLGNYQTKEVWYYDNGKIMEELFYFKVKLHREDGPANIWYYEDGNIQKKMYIIKGKLHREAGPAVVYYDENGVLEGESYYLNGKKLTSNKFEKELIKKKLKLIR